MVDYIGEYYRGYEEGYHSSHRVKECILKLAVGHQHLWCCNRV